MVFGFDNDVLLGVGAGAAILYYYYSHYVAENGENKGPIIIQRKFTIEDLALYSGSDNRLCYIACAINDNDSGNLSNPKSQSANLSNQIKVYDVTKHKTQFSSSKLGGKHLTSSDDLDTLASLLTTLKTQLHWYPQVGTLIVPRPFTLEELSKYDGRNSENGNVVYIGAKGMVFEVDKGFYGPGGPYGCMAGRDASRALALVSLSEEDVAKGGDLSGLSRSELNTLDEWVMKFESKYDKVGYLVSDSATHASN